MEHILVCCNISSLLRNRKKFTEKQEKSLRCCFSSIKCFHSYETKWVYVHFLYINIIKIKYSFPDSSLERKVFSCGHSGCSKKYTKLSHLKVNSVCPIKEIVFIFTLTRPTYCPTLERSPTAVPGKIVISSSPGLMNSPGTRGNMQDWSSFSVIFVQELSLGQTIWGNMSADTKTMLDWWWHTLFWDN